MPYPNEHAARLLDPDIDHIRVTRTSGSGDGMVKGVKVPDTIDVIWYIVNTADGEAPRAQALRFPISKWTEDEARKWLEDNKIEPMSFEPAAKPEPERSAAPISVKVLGEKAKPAYKVLPIVDCKAVEEDGALYLSGYANTKNHPDRYGDVPTVFSARRNFVYNIDEYRNNPVLLIDHQNSVGHIAGSMVDISEDEKGLHFKAKFSNSDLPLIAHARQVAKEGHAKGISIAGRFHYENPDAPEQLTLADIFEISLVAVPADPDSLASVEKSVNITKLENELKSLTSNLQSAKISTGISNNFAKIKTAVEELAAKIKG